MAISASAMLTAPEIPTKTMSRIFVILPVHRGSLPIQSLIAALNTVRLATIGNLQAQILAGVCSKMVVVPLCLLIL